MDIANTEIDILLYLNVDKSFLPKKYGVLNITKYYIILKDFYQRINI